MWEFKKKAHAITSATERALKILERKNVIVVVGLHGDGKTSLGMYLMSQITGRRRLKINFHHIDTLSIRPCEKYLIFMDDCFDNEDEINKHGQHLDYLLPKIKDGTIKVIIACTPSRFQLCTANKFISEYFQSDCIIHISGNGNEISRNDKTLILLSHLQQQLPDKVIEEIVEAPSPFGFLKCIEMMRKDTINVDNFRKITNQYCFEKVRTLYVFHENSFRVLLKVFQNGFIKRQMNACVPIEKGKDALILDRTIDALVADCILTSNGIQYSFSHYPLFEEFMAKILASKCPTIFITSCSLRFLSWIDIDNTGNRLDHSNESRVWLAHLDIVFERIRNELLTKKKVVFETISCLSILEHITPDHVQSIKDMKDEDNISLFVHVTRTSKKNNLEALLNGIQYDDLNQILKEILIESCRVGNKDIYEMILSQTSKKLEDMKVKTADYEVLDETTSIIEPEKLPKDQLKENISSYLQNILDDEGNNILMIAAKSGNRDLVVFIYEQHTALFNLNNLWGETVFHAAVSSTNLDVVKFVVKELSENEFIAKDNEGNTGLHVAAKLDNIAVTEFLAERSPDVFAREQNNNGISPMHACVIHGQVDILSSIKEIVKKERTKTGETILHLAARHCKHVAQFKKIIESTNYSDFLEARDNEGRTALHAAAESGTKDVFLQLLSFGLSIDATTNTGDTVSHRAASNGNMAVLLYLLLRCEHLPTLVNEFGFTILHSSVLSNSIEIFTTLVNAKLSTKDVTKQNQTILHVASRHGSKDIVNYILHNLKYIIKRRDIDGMTALHFSAIGGHIYVFKLLLQFKLSLTSIANNGRTVLHLAVENNNHKLVDYILHICDDHEFLQSKDADGMTVLHIAAKQGFVNIFKELKERIFPRQKLNYFTIKSKTVLLIAIAPGHADMVRYLLTCDGIKDIIQQTDCDKLTALHHAAVCGDVDVYKALEKEISIKCVTSNGDNVLHLASKYGNLKMIQHIYRCKYRLELKRNKSYQSPLHFAFQNRHPDVVEELLKEGMCLSDRANDGSGCIHYAALSGQFEMVELVLKTNPCAINRIDHFGHTALFYSIKAGCIKSFDMLVGKCSSKHFVADNKGSYDTILLHAIRLGNVDFVKHILEYHPELRHVRNCYGNSCMHVASEEGVYISN